MTMQSVRMIAFDLDGTLLTDTKEITDYTKEILDCCAQKKIYIVPSTGRSIAGVPKIVRELQGVEYLVTSNGARIVANLDNSVIYNETVNVETTEAILSILKDYDTLTEVYVDGQGYFQRDKTDIVEVYTKDPAMAKYIRATRIPVDNVRLFFKEVNCPQDKIHAIFYNEKDRDEAWKRLEKLGGTELSSSMRTNIEINAPGVHKGNALTMLGKHLGINSEKIMAFGDGGNDVKMLQEVGIGVAMGNASEEVKKAADHVTLSNEEDGVAAFIYKHILN